MQLLWGHVTVNEWFSFCVRACVCLWLRCAVWNWSRRWRRIRSSLRHCRLWLRSTTNLSNLSSRDLHHAASSVRMNSTTPCLVSWQLSNTLRRLTSSCSLLSFTSRTLEYFFLPVNVFGELPFPGCVAKRISIWVLVLGVESLHGGVAWKQDLWILHLPIFSCGLCLILTFWPLV